MKYLIGIDSGGSKTEAVCFSEDGHILGRTFEPGGNALDIGLAEARTRILRSIKRTAAFAPQPLAAVFAGVAGSIYYEDFFGYDIRPEIAAESFRIESDGPNLISAGLIHREDGCCLICGTGCGCWVRREALGKPFHFGGWGYLIDTEGSGYMLGRNVIRAACFAKDERGPQTLLTELLRKRTGLSLMESIPELYKSGRAGIAKLAGLVFEAAAEKDEAALTIMGNGAEALASLIRCADRYFEEDFPLILGGGIMYAFPEYVEEIRKRSPERAKFRLSNSSPVFGSAVEAMHDAGLEVTDEFVRTYLADYAALEK